VIEDAESVVLLKNKESETQKGGQNSEKQIIEKS
jgi:hypothetical protein